MGRDKDVGGGQWEQVGGVENKSEDKDKGGGGGGGAGERWNKSDKPPHVDYY